MGTQSEDLIAKKTTLSHLCEVAEMFLLSVATYELLIRGMYHSKIHPEYIMGIMIFLHLSFGMVLIIAGTIGLWMTGCYAIHLATGKEFDPLAVGTCLYAVRLIFLLVL